MSLWEVYCGNGGGKGQKSLWSCPCAGLRVRALDDDVDSMELTLNSLLPLCHMSCLPLLPTPYSHSVCFYPLSGDFPLFLLLPLCVWSLNSSPGSPLPHVGAALTVTTHPHISIKSEPVSPSRERSPAPPPPAVFPAARPDPGEGLSSPAGGSYETGDRDDGRGDFGPTLGLLRPAPEPEADGSAVKRMRLDTWVL